MEDARAALLLRALANGVDPITGDTFAPSSPLQHPDLVRALFAGVGALEGQRKAGTRSKDIPKRTGRSWDEREDEDLASRFDAGASVAELAERHRRTTGAIRARLARLGKVDPSRRE